MDMLSAMRSFVRVVEHMSFSRAAQVLGVQTSAVSRSVAALETELGVDLFTRTTRSLHLTEPRCHLLPPRADRAARGGRGTRCRLGLEGHAAGPAAARAARRFRAASYHAVHGGVPATVSRPAARPLAVRRPGRPRLRRRRRGGADRTDGRFLADRAKARATPAHRLRQPRLSCRATAAAPTGRPAAARLPDLFAAALAQLVLRRCGGRADLCAGPWPDAGG